MQNLRDTKAYVLFRGSQKKFEGIWISEGFPLILGVILGTG